jgi:hypothetical protein
VPRRPLPPPGDLADAEPAVPHPRTRLGRLERFFFVHLGTLYPILVYFHRAQDAGFTMDGVANASLHALGAGLAYAALARWRGQLKQADIGLLLLWATGAVTTRLGPTAVADLFVHYSPALIFVAFGLTAVVPLLLRRTPFTDFYLRRQVPAWQLHLSVTHEISRLMAAFWTLVFFAAAAVAASRPTEPTYTTFWPNLIVFVVGIPAALWLPPLYLKLFPPPRPTRADALVLGLPMAFDARRAGPARATFQFHVTGEVGGSWCVRVADGRCTAFVGTAHAPDLTIRTPADVWVRVAHGELDGGDALMQGLYTVEGDYALLPKLGEWFAV